MRFSARGKACLAAVFAAVVDAIYLLVIDGQRTPVASGRIVLVASSLGAAAILGAVGALVPKRLPRTVLLSLSASTLLVWTFLGAMSIGIVIALPGLLMLVSLVQTFDDESWLDRLVALVAAGVVLCATAVGLSLT
jgi:hypothetical protein